MDLSEEVGLYSKWESPPDDLSDSTNESPVVELTQTQLIEKLMKQIELDKAEKEELKA
jgi:hypothetical protein